MDVDSDWYDMLLVLLDVYIFRAVHASFKEANEAMSKNAEIRKAKEAMKKKKQTKSKDVEKRKNS